VAKKADFFVAGTTFNREAHLKAHGDVPLVKSDGVSRQCIRGLLLGEVLPSNDVCPGGGSTREGAVGGRVNYCDPARWLNRPLTPKGEAEGQGWGESSGQYCCALTPRPLSGGRGGIGPGTPRDPGYPGSPGKGGGAGGGTRVDGWTTSAHDKCWLGTQSPANMHFSPQQISFTV
jgi:hypothetical protein